MPRGRDDEEALTADIIRVARKLKVTDVINVLSDLFILRGVPGHVPSNLVP